MKKRQAKSENVITLAYLGMTVVLMLVAFFTFPWIEPPKPQAEINQPLFDWETLSEWTVSELQNIFINFFLN